MRFHTNICHYLLVKLVQKTLLLADCVHFDGQIMREKLLSQVMIVRKQSSDFGWYHKLRAVQEIEH